MLNNRILSLFLSCLLASSTLAQEILYTMPSEEHAHEGTWIQWPHNYTYSWGASDFVPAFRAWSSPDSRGKRMFTTDGLGTLETH